MEVVSRMAALAAALSASMGFSVAAPTVQAQPPLVPRAVFFSAPAQTAVRISPDGRRLSYLAQHEGVATVWVQTIGQSDARPVTSVTGRPIRRYFWAANGEQIIYPREGDGGQHVYAVDIATGEERDLSPLEGVRARVIAIDRAFPDEILVGINDRDRRHDDVWRVNARTGERALVFENAPGYAMLDADSAFRVRLAMRINGDGGQDLFTRDEPGGEWYELVRFGFEDAAASRWLGFSRDGRSLYLVDARSADTGRLHAFTIAGDEGPSYDLLAHDDRCDVDEVVFDPETGTPQAVAFNHQRRVWRILDPSLEPDWSYLSTVRDGDLSLVSRDLADERWIVAYERGDGPLAYYLYDRAARRAEYLFSNRPALDDLSLATMRATIIRARDGLPLVSYLTLPPQTPPRNLPMVLLVHGGPWARDSWGYNPLHQWLANRGYAVLSVNFRGSAGFGKRFLNAGSGEWAAAMHDDLIDAVNWAVSQNIADPDRVAIMGGSYGGYATLVGLTMTPDFFAAGVDIAGPSNVRTLLESIPPSRKPVRAMFEARIGRLDEPGYLDQISPITRVDRIRRPLLIIQGGRDTRATEEDSDRIVSAMEARNIPVTCMLFPDEGHGLARRDNNLAMLAVAEAFLAEHLGGRYESIGSAVRSSSAEIHAGVDLIPGLARATR